MQRLLPIPAHLFLPRTSSSSFYLNFLICTSPLMLSYLSLVPCVCVRLCVSVCVG
eukprot:m.52178 g.52178  ORF g.52178 m.52178 type:complete len:55 (-) comp11288_c1_seq2:217-381(-)